MPEIDGFTVLEHLRSSGSRMPVIVLTARDSVTDTVSALETNISEAPIISGLYNQGYSQALGAAQTSAPPLPGAPGAGAIGRPADPLYDSAKIMAYSNGNPSEAFGEPYRVFDRERVADYQRMAAALRSAGSARASSHRSPESTSITEVRLSSLSSPSFHAA